MLKKTVDKDKKLLWISPFVVFLGPQLAPMQLYSSTADLQKALRSEKSKRRSVGLVPTMGALHSGHLSLVKRSLYQNDITIVSIFVNPTQFNDKNDLAAYPRTLDKDLNLLSSERGEIWVYAPQADDIYSGDISSKKYDFKGLDRVMEGPNRPGHFEGVATIVERLLRIVRPHHAYFGEKDYQQLLIISRVAKQKRLGVKIIGCGIVREDSGLAMSSRNQRLNSAAISEATFIYQQLLWAKRRFTSMNLSKIKEAVTEAFNSNPSFELEYFEIAEAAALTAHSERKKNKKYRAFIAAKIDGVRLIDNLAMN